LPIVDVPEHPDLFAGAGRRELEQVAAKVRAAWKLPLGQVGNVVRLLEAHGIVVVRLRSDGPRVDAFSRWFETRPLVILWDGKDDKARSRFDAAHELGHLVMHHEAQPGGRELERQAHAFAAAFLMPAEQIIDSLPRRTPRANDWERLFDLRRRWGVSVAALLYRARELGTLPEAGFRRSMIRLAEMGLRHHDGAALGEPEQPALLAHALAALARGRGTELSEIANDLRFSQRQLEDVLGNQVPARRSLVGDMDARTPSTDAPDLAPVAVLRGCLLSELRCRRRLWLSPALLRAPTSPAAP